MLFLYFLLHHVSTWLISPSKVSPPLRISPLFTLPPLHGYCRWRPTSCCLPTHALLSYRACLYQGHRSWLVQTEDSFILITQHEPAFRLSAFIISTPYSPYQTKQLLESMSCLQLFLGESSTSWNLLVLLSVR